MKKYTFCSVLMACCSVCFVDVASAQGLQQSAGGGGRGNDLMNLLRNEMVQKELDLVDEQVEEIESVMEEMWSEMRERMGKMRDIRDLTPEERRDRYADIRKEMDDRRSKYQEEIDEVLLPNQLERLKQIGVQSRARRYGDGSIGVLQNKEFLAELGIDEETQEKLAKKTEEVLEKLQKQVVELRKKAEKEILGVLPSESRKKLSLIHI